MTDKTSQVWVAVSYHFTRAGEIGTLVQEAVELLERQLQELGYTVKYQIEQQEAHAAGRHVGQNGPPPREFREHERRIEAANLDREDGPVGDRIRDLLNQNERDIRARYEAERQTERREIIIDALLDVIERGSGS